MDYLSKTAFKVKAVLYDETDESIEEIKKLIPKRQQQNCSCITVTDKNTNQRKRYLRINRVVISPQNYVVIPCGLLKPYLENVGVVKKEIFEKEFFTM